MKKNLFFSISIFFLLIVFFSCRKADRDSDTSTVMVSDNSFVVFFFNDVFKQVHQLALSDTSLCSIDTLAFADTLCIDTITRTNIPGFFPDTITVDYGLTNGTACADGNLRRGKLKMIFSGKYNATLKSVTVIPENYFVNDYNVEGKTTITCKGKNSSNNYYFPVNVSNGTVSNDVMRWQFSTTTLQREWMAGASSATITDDVFNISGTYSGTASKGTTYTSEITTALRNQFDCKWIAGGVEKIIPENLSPRIVNYGSSCDNKATVNINGKDYDTTLLP